MLDKVKVELQTLSRLGDMVTPEDVIEGAGTLVAHGAPAAQMASLLADMPQSGGPQLQGWLRQHEAFVAQKEAELGPAHQVAGHRAAVTGLQMLQGHGSLSAAPQATNPMMPGGQPAAPDDAGLAGPPPNALGA